ncbi:MAG: hypothetical protein RLZZ104_660, partial [Pseudomonadota bacterium]
MQGYSATRPRHIQTPWLRAIAAIGVSSDRPFGGTSCDPNNEKDSE